MEKEEYIQKESFFKIRSYTSCFKKGFELYIRNFKLLFKLLWLPILFSALIQTAFVYFMQTIPQTNITANLPFLLTIGGILLILWLLINCFKFGTLFSIFNKYKEDGVLPTTLFKTLKNDIFHYSCRTLKFDLWVILYLIIASAMIGFIFFAIKQGLGVRSTGIMGYLIFLFTGLLIMLFHLVVFNIPMIYVGMSYMMGNEGFLKSFIKSYKIAFRHWGTIFALSLITSIVTMGTILLLNMPEYILLIVRRLSTASIEFGDTAGLPQGFVIFSLIVIFLCSFLQVYVGLFYYFPMLFQYASIESDVLERQEQDKLNAKEDYDTMTSLASKKKYEEENFIYRS